MIQLILLFLGAEIIRRRWRSLCAAGIVWLLFGIALCVDALDGTMWVRPAYFGIAMILEGLVTFLAALGSNGTARRMRLAYGGVIVGVGLLMIDAPWHNDLAIALVAGLALVADGVWRFASAWVVRFPGWRLAIANAVFELLLAVVALEPWPTWYKGEVGTLAGILFIVSGVNLVRIALQLRTLPAGTPLGTVFNRGRARLMLEPIMPAVPEAGSETDDTTAAGLTVYVWTPTEGVRVPVYQSVTRYIAARDEDGVISTGHAALGLDGDLYISHYPAVEIDRDAGNFAQALRATTDNDVPGRFLPSYAEEAAGWCEASFRVTFKVFDAHRLCAFWQAYRQDSTYNLTNRNCSSAVANALEVSVEGVLDRHRNAVPSVGKMLLSPELWMAGLIRQRAMTMTWTPGLVLDYARALNATLSPPLQPWWVRLRDMFKAISRQYRRGHGHPGSGMATPVGP